jgi:hypothetical protein
MKSNNKDPLKDLVIIFTILIFCLFIVPLYQLFGILFHYRISLIYKYLWVVLFTASHLTNTFFVGSYYKNGGLSQGESVILIVLMMLNPYTFLFFNVAVSYNKFFPEETPFFNAIPQYLLAYYCLLTFTLLVLVFLVDEHQFRKVFIKHENNKTEYSGQFNRLSLINEPSEDDDND